MNTRFLKENFALIVGLTLPVLLMAGFMVAANLPSTLSDPPQYDLIFAVADYPANLQSLPVSVRLVVRDGVLKGQYTKNTPAPGNVYVGGPWKKLYRYQAGPQTVRELSFGFPPDTEAITGTREDTVEATADLTLDTTLRSPDGYELTYGNTGRSGLLTDLFWSSYSTEPRLRKGSSSVRLTTGDSRTYFYAGNVEFIGWVTAKK